MFIFRLALCERAFNHNHDHPLTSLLYIIIHITTEERCCPSIVIADRESARPWVKGVYHISTKIFNGHPVYKQANGFTYLKYQRGLNAWAVGPSLYQYGFRSTADPGSCPTSHANGKWQEYFRGDLWKDSIGFSVSCFRKFSLRPVCVCACVTNIRAHAHTHTHKYTQRGTGTSPQIYVLTATPGLPHKYRPIEQRQHESTKPNESREELTNQTTNQPRTNISLSP